MSIECILASRETIDLMVIMPGVVIKEKHFDNDITPSTLFAVSKSGYTNDLLSLKWLKHFDLKTYKKKKGR
jgi:hypothetical protein